MIHPIKVRACDSCHLDTPEGIRVISLRCFAAGFGVFFSISLGTEQGVSMHAVLLVDLSTREWRQCDSLPG